MIVKEIQVTYFVKRSVNFQSIDTGMTVTVGVEEGEKPCEVYKATMKHIAACVETEAAAALRDVAYVAGMDT